MYYGFFMIVQLGEGVCMHACKALKKMKEIIEIQGGDPKIDPEKISIGEHSIALRAPCDGFVTNVDNAAITAITRVSGAPIEKGSWCCLTLEERI